MTAVDIRVKDNRQHFVVGDTVSGVAEVTLPADIPTSNVTVSFHCVGEVKWIEYPGTAHYLNGYLYFDQFDYFQELFQFSQNDIQIDPFVDHKKVHIPYSFIIPKDINLPSTMISNHGSIRYYVRVSIEEKDEVKKFTKEVNVQAPFQKDLMITVGGTVEKTVLLHGGAVSMHASIARKGFTPGEPITVHVVVNNKTNTTVVPRITLNQVQIYMCGIRHKTIESAFPSEPIKGTEIAPHSEVEEVLNVAIPADESLTIKSSVISVKYFVNVTLNIPHSFDLHLNLPVVVTSKKVLDALRLKKDNKPLQK